MSGTSSDPEPTLRGYASGHRVFGRYVLKCILGHGGMGVVWRARDETLAEDIALKFLPDSVRWDPGAFEDLKAETRRARQLTHPNIIRIHDFVEDASSAAISMELVDGRTLTQVRCDKLGRVLDPGDILPWLPQLSAALDYAHQQAKVVHRDLKPSNIMLTREGTVKVGDFGIARSLADSITRVSMMSAGTLVYMSPQQAMGEEPSPSDDIYSLGATLYELLTGKPPFHTGDVRVQLFHRKPEPIAVRRRAAAPGSARAHMPSEWEEAIAACLAKDPAERPPSAGEVAAQVRGSNEGNHDGDGSLERQRVGRTRWRRLHSLALAATLLAGAEFVTWRFRASAVAAAAWPSDATRALASWNMDGDGVDGSGRGWHARTVELIPTVDRHGRIDRALHFNGNGTMVIPDSPALRWGGTAGFTAAIWLKPGRRDLSTEVWSSVPDTIDGLTWWVGLAGGAASAMICRRQNDQVTPVTGAASLAPDEWHHVAAVSNGSELTLYADGVVVGRQDLEDNRTALAPGHVEIRIGRQHRSASTSYYGDADEARLWSRPLAPDEIASLASREKMPAFMVSRGVYGDRDDLEAAVRAEFGPTARVADWEDVRRWHAHDTRAWLDELGVTVGNTTGWMQRAGVRRFDDERTYFATRFEGAKPEYYMSHDEIGGMALSLGSWYGSETPVLAVLPARTLRSERLTVDADGAVRRKWASAPRAVALQLSWQAELFPDRPDAVVASVHGGGGRSLRAECISEHDTFAVSLGDEARPQRIRHLAPTYGQVEYTLVARDRSLRFRAVSVPGGRVVFDEALPIDGFLLSEVARLEIMRPGAAGRLAGSTLFQEE